MSGDHKNSSISVSSDTTLIPSRKVTFRGSIGDSLELKIPPLTLLDPVLFDAEADRSQRKVSSNRIYFAFNCVPIQAFYEDPRPFLV